MSSGTSSYDEKSDAYYEFLRPEMLAYVPKEARKVLEVGCGSGIFAGQLKAERNVEIWGIELVKDAATKASKVLDKVIIGNIETDKIDLPSNYFDCIIFNDVLEHLLDPWEVLRKLGPALVENGCVVASIPNIRHFDVIQPLLYYKEWKYADEGVLDRTHLRFFTQKTMGDLFAVSGYEIVRIEGIRSIEFPWKFRVFNWLSGNKFDDMRFIQFACVAKKTDRAVSGEK